MMSKRAGWLVLATVAAVGVSPTFAVENAAIPAVKTAAVSSATELPTLLKEVEAKYKQAVTVSANFEENTQSVALNQNKRNTGTIQFKRPGKIRWETLKPDHNLLVSDGVRFWFYTPPFDKDEPGQYWERKAGQVQSKFAQALLSGTFSSNKSMTVKKLSETDFRVIPKKGSAGTVQEATLHIDTAQKLITSVSLVHKGGNNAKITLSNIQLGQPLEDKLFQFTPPPNTELMKDN